MSEPGGIRKRLRDAMTTAVKTRDSSSVDAFRSALSAIANAEAAEDSSVPARGHVIAKSRLGVGAGEGLRRDLSEDDVLAIVRGEIQERIEAAVEYERLGHVEHACELRSEAQALSAVVAGG